ncbi:uncharacterized protein MELLADRAFT_94882 [Melampsora larici-populina 98AG31]|uniref:Uncharacterized protein n=1 Tax=Melampsora larici-populina (strain 98AG31 / pathotype 3-4-7) TaxID=747676 RepID=F4S894_MELLP|nr:uncharacterized protein MELLADRAFT_94882 [Melampsora larici-populina 98AG31]EGF99153.1 hypothetical protein MELLADRAFT_94882 [Melampsora larici-populina 98AG31]
MGCTALYTMYSDHVIFRESETKIPRGKSIYSCSDFKGLAQEVKVNCTLATEYKTSHTILSSLCAARTICFWFFDFEAFWWRNRVVCDFVVRSRLFMKQHHSVLFEDIYTGNSFVPSVPLFALKSGRTRKASKTRLAQNGISFQRDIGESTPRVPDASSGTAIDGWK